jgi:hypothetical protein
MDPFKYVYIVDKMHGHEACDSKPKLWVHKEKKVIVFQKEK